jgi:hemerythrin
MGVTFKMANAWYGHELLDTQHRDILEMHDLIKDLARQGKYGDLIKGALWDLHGILIEHFFHEEYAIKLLHDNKYQHYIKQHVRSHDHILDAIEQVCELIRSDEKHAINAFLPDMMTMLLDKMMSDDNRLIEYLIDEGIELQPSDVYPCE